MENLFFSSLITVIQTSNFYEFAALLFLVVVGGVLGSFLKQPLIIIFIVTGIIAGPSFLGIVSGGEEIELLSKLGITILLFIVGLKLDVKLIKGLGVISAIIGGTQIFFTVLLGFGLCLLLGFSFNDSLFISIALAFSSTIVIVKILSDKKEIDSAYGKMALGVLIIQDLAVVVTMIVLATIGGEGEAGSVGVFESLVRVSIYSVILFAVVGVFMKCAALKVVSYVARNSELLLIFSIAWAVFLAAICSKLGLSKELGGLLAGVTFASTPYREAIVSRLGSLRDFLLLFFFIALGLQVDLSAVGGVVFPAIVISIFVLLFKPLVIMAIAGLTGYRKRTGFMAGISLAQISEFSLIFITSSYGLGLVSKEVFGLVTLVALITITISTYLLAMSNKLYLIFEKFIGSFEKECAHKEEEFDDNLSKKSYNIVILGLGSYGKVLAEEFINVGKRVLVVDFNPDLIKKWTKSDALFGDAFDPEFFTNLPLKGVEWVISSMPPHKLGELSEDPRSVMLEALKENNYKGKTAVTCYHVKSIDKFSKLGADQVFLPYRDAAKRAVNVVLDNAC